MSRCSDCVYLSGMNCKAYYIAQEKYGRLFPKHPLGGCLIPIIEGYDQYILNNMHVLEIGCGSFSEVMNICNKKNADYEGIDVLKEYFGKKTVATRIENLADLSYPNNYFDLVVGNQTMEHWEENGCTLIYGLFQCFRVLKKGGWVFMNVPIHFHGTKQFMLGRVEDIKNIFSIFSNIVLFETWGYPSFPISECYPFPKYWKLKRKPAYILNIKAKKDKIVSLCDNKGAYRGYLSQIINYPFSYNLYRILKKIINM